MNKLPVELISDGSPQSLIIRNPDGETIDIAASQLRKPFVGLTMVYTSATTFKINPGLVDGAQLVSSLTKTLDAFVMGDNNGSLDGGSITADTFYYVFVIQNNTTDDLDILISLSATTPNIPSGWSSKKRIGTLYVNTTSVIEPFIQFNNYFKFKNEIFISRTDGVASYNIVHKLPAQIEITAHLQASLLLTISAQRVMSAKAATDVGAAHREIVSVFPGGTIGFVNQFSVTEFLVYALNTNTIEYAIVPSGTNSRADHHTIGWWDWGL